MQRILYIEDDAGQRYIIERFYQKCCRAFHGEVEFKCVVSWKLGEEAVKQWQPDVVILDLTLPPQSYLDTIEELEKVIKSWPPVIVLTGDQLREEELRVKLISSVGAADFMMKMKANQYPEDLCERVYLAYLRRQYGNSTGF